MDNPCECEHLLHFPTHGESRVRVRHQYGRAKAVMTVKTEYGPFQVCQDCAEQHFLPRVGR